MTKHKVGTHLYLGKFMLSKLDDLELAIKNDDDTRAEGLINEINVDDSAELDLNRTKMSAVLEAAILRDKLNTVMLMVKKWPELLDAFGEEIPAIHYAASRGRLDIVKGLLNHKPDLIALKYGGTFSVYAVTAIAKKLDIIRHLNSLNIVKHLLSLEPDFINDSVRFKDAIALGHHEFVDFVLSVNPKMVDTKFKEGVNVLYLACAHGKYEIAKKFLAIKPELIDEKDDNGGSVLHAMTKVSSPESIELLKYLISIKPKLINAKNNSGATLLHLAIIHNNTVRVTVLIDINPELIDEILITDTISLSALEMASIKGNFDTFIYLVIKGAYLGSSTFEQLEQLMLRNSEISSKGKAACCLLISIIKDIDKLINVSCPEDKNIEPKLPNDYMEKIYNENGYKNLFLMRLKHLWMKQVKAGDKTLDDFEAALVSHQGNIPQHLYEQACGILSRLKEGLIDVKALAKTVVECKEPKDLLILPKYYPTIRFFKDIDLMGLGKLLPGLNKEQVQLLKSTALGLYQSDYLALTSVTRIGTNFKGKNYLSKIPMVAISRHLPTPSSYVRSLQKGEDGVVRVGR